MFCYFSGSFSCLANELISKIEELPRLKLTMVKQLGVSVTSLIGI